LRLDVHFHALLLDGVYEGFETGERLAFHQATPLHDDEVAHLARHVKELINGHLRRRGYLDEDLALIDESESSLDEQATHHAAAIQGLIPFGPRAGRQALLFGEAPASPLPPRPPKKLCADVAGYSLHAALRIGAGKFARLERLCRYIARPPLAQHRLSVSSDGSVIYEFRKPWRSGQVAVVMDPMTFISRLAAQVPPPRFHVLSYYGVLAPAAARRDEIVPGQQDGEDPARQSCIASSAAACNSSTGREKAKAKRSRPERLAWAELVKRVFLEDVLACACGGRRRVLAMVFDPVSIERVLRHLGLRHERPARAPPRRLQAELGFCE
jgi:hypothetical protein